MGWFLPGSPGSPGSDLSCVCLTSDLQEDFELDGQARFPDPGSTSESTTPMEGENMGGWWPEHSPPDTGVAPGDALSRHARPRPRRPSGRPRCRRAAALQLLF